MPIYFFSAGIDPAEATALESRLRPDIPELQKVDGVEELSRRLPPRPQSGAQERSYVLFPFSHANVSVDRLIEMAARGRDVLFFIFISDDVSASDYKRLVRAGNADWVSSHSAPQEVADIISRHQRGFPVNQVSERAKRVFVSFVPSAGGVGNATVAIESAIHIKTNKATRNCAVCLVDLDFQTSHVCDLLDIDPRLQLGEISLNPERLDAQLFELFVSHHSTGLDVLAAARSKEANAEPSIVALDALFAMISQRYDVVLVDLPVTWFSFTRHILSASDLAIVVGLNTIPNLRQVADTIKAIRELDPSPQTVVVLNRCERSLLGGVVNRNYAKRMLNAERVFHIRDHSAAARDSVNTGVPISLASPSNRISKDVAKLAALVSDLHATRTQVRTPGKAAALTL